MLLNTVKTIVLCFLWLNIAWAQSGALDLDFADQGAAKYFDVTHRPEIRVILQANDGSIITVGERRNGFGSQLQMLGYTENGEINNHFGGGNLLGIPTWGYPGVINTDFPDIDWESAFCAKLQDDGKILIGGNAGLLTPGCLIARYLPDGGIDPTFNTTGYNYIQQGNLTKVEALHFLPSGNIVAAGLVGDLIGVALILQDGTLSSNFGDNGLLTLGQAHFSNVDMSVDSKGRIVIVATHQAGSEYSIVILRMKQNGDLDVSFGTAGKMNISFGSQGIFGVHIYITNDDQITITGEEKEPFTDPTKLFLAKVDVDGHLDPSFGTNGSITHKRGETITPHDLVVQSDGKLLVTGRFADNAVADLFVAKFDANGFFDRNFGNNGLALSGLALDQGNNTAIGRAIAIQESGKILAAGTIKETALNKSILVRFDNEIGGGETTPIDNTLFREGTLEVFPNPFTNQLNLKWSGGQPAKYQILDALGRIISDGVISGSSVKINIENDHLPSHLFSVRLQSEGEVLYHKMVRIN